VDRYLASLFASTLPAPIWALALLWLLLLLCSYVLLSWGQRLRAAQSCISFPAGLQPRLSVRLFTTRVALAFAVFLAADLLGGPSSVFFAGGWWIMTAVTLSSNLRSALFLQALAEPRNARGNTEYSPRFARRTQATELSSAALLCLLLGLLLPHLALLGAALFLAAAALGYFRKARALSPP
jgi:hypothetical protein